MITIVLKSLLFKLMRRFGFPGILPINFTLSLLYSCNSRCKTCNIWKKEARNMSVSEIEYLFSKIGKAPYWITLSGGEPFLREDIVDICKVIYRHSKPAIINIPTNGLLTNRIVEALKQITSQCPRTQFIINLSIDGIEEQHDRIRQVPGNYDKAMKTFEKLLQLKQDNLTVGIHTVISKYNVNDFVAIANTMLAKKPDSYITEIAEERHELDTINAEITPDLISYRSAIDFLIHRIKNGNFKGMNKITQAFRIEYYNLVKTILRDKTQVIPCYAGIASAQISPDGEVWSCCIKAESLGNLRDNDYDFRKIWFSRQADQERKSIKNKECYCPLANASYTNMLMDFPTLFRVFFRSFIKWW